MRTVKRISLPLNAGKWEQLEALVSRYAQEKQAHLSYYLQGETFAVPPSDRVRRDELVKAGYISPVGLQARAWKLALKDAHETVVKWWAVWSEEIRSRIHKLDWTETQRHYAYWLLYAEPRLAQLILGRAPLNEKIKLTLTQRQAVTSYLRRTLRKLRGKYPQVKQVRSLALDANMYTVRPNTHIQVIEVAGLVAGQRIPLVLRGHTTIKGNLRLILDRTTRGVAIHTGFELQAAPLTGEMAATDAGLTEAFTDEKGNRYGTEPGVTLVKASDQLCDKGRKRNKLHVVRKKALARGDLAKAARIQAHNLGRRTQQRTTKKLQLTVARIINHGINELVNTRQMGELVTEKLDLRGPTKSKSLARQVSLWHRSILNDRLDFKASAKGFSRQEVNPAYRTCLQ